MYSRTILYIKYFQVIKYDHLNLIKCFKDLSSRTRDKQYNNVI